MQRRSGHFGLSAFSASAEAETRGAAHRVCVGQAECAVQTSVAFFSYYVLLQMKACFIVEEQFEDVL